MVKPIDKTNLHKNFTYRLPVVSRATYVAVVWLVIFWWNSAFKTFSKYLGHLIWLFWLFWLPQPSKWFKRCCNIKWRFFQIHTCTWIIWNRIIESTCIWAYIIKCIIDKHLSSICFWISKVSTVNHFIIYCFTTDIIFVNDDIYFLKICPYKLCTLRI